MSASAPIKPWLAGADPVTVTDGEGGTYILTPSGEGASAGTITPHPGVVGSVQMDRAVRVVRCRSGQRASTPLASARRATMTLNWTGLSKSQRDTVNTFLRVTCKGGQIPFSVHVDGGSDNADLINVRQIGPLEDTMTENGSGPVYELSVRVEETF